MPATNNSEVSGVPYQSSAKLACEKTCNKAKPETNPAPMRAEQMEHRN